MGSAASSAFSKMPLKVADWALTFQSEGVETDRDKIEYIYKKMGDNAFDEITLFKATSEEM